MYVHVCGGNPLGVCTYMSVGRNPLGVRMYVHVCGGTSSLCAMYVHMKEGNPLESMYGVGTYVKGNLLNIPVFIQVHVMWEGNPLNPPCY